MYTFNYIFIDNKLLNSSSISAAEELVRFGVGTHTATGSLPSKRLKSFCPQMRKKPGVGAITISDICQEFSLKDTTKRFKQEQQSFEWGPGCDILQLDQLFNFKNLLNISLAE